MTGIVNPAQSDEPDQLKIGATSSTGQRVIEEAYEDQARSVFIFGFPIPSWTVFEK